MSRFLKESHAMSDIQATALFHRAAGTVTRLPGHVVDASVQLGAGRARRRRLVHLAEAAAVAAVVASAATLGVSSLGDRGASTVGQASHDFGIDTDQMATALSAMLPAPASIEPGGDAVPGWLEQVFNQVEFPALISSGEARLTSVTYRSGTDQANVAVVVERLSTATLEPVRHHFCDATPTSACTETGLGSLIVLAATGSVGTQPGLVTLLTEDGWLVQAATTDTMVVPSATLVQIAVDKAWLA